MSDIADDFIQYMMDKLNQSYSEYKKNHPDFKRVVEEQLEGKTDAEFEAQFKETRTHCEYMWQLASRLRRM